MLKELLRAFFLIFAAEMGDKTQIIAMTFATQYAVREVLGGVALGVFFNHGLAIILGTYLSRLIPIASLQIVAGIMFVFFGFMALKDDGEDDEDDKVARKFGPVLTVALAFFIGELGDKTQLTAMTLSTEAVYPIFILMGTILGMLATSSLGIFVGSKIGDRIPDFYIKIVSSIVFIFFGSLKLYSELPGAYLSRTVIVLYLIAIVVFEYVLVKRLLKKTRSKKTPIQQAAERLYIHNKVLSNAVEDICLGEGSCGNCQGVDCIIGYTKYILENARENKNYYSEDEVALDKICEKNFDRDKVSKALGLILSDYRQNGFIYDDSFIVNRVRAYLEIILFSREIKSTSIEEYLSSVKKIDTKVAEILERQINML